MAQGNEEILMSTNFYIRESSLEEVTGQLVTKDSHIGLRAGGWTFMFQASETRTVEDWITRTENLAPNMSIVDEYGATYSHEEFWNVVYQTTQPWGPNKIQPKTPSAKGAPGESWVKGDFNFTAREFS